MTNAYRLEQITTTFTISAFKPVSVSAFLAVIKCNHHHTSAVDNSDGSPRLLVVFDVGARRLEILLPYFLLI